MQESDDFVDYKDWKKAPAAVDDAKETVECMIEDAAPSLILRKRKQMEKPGASDDKVPEVSTSSSSTAENTAADAVALLLKHQCEYFAADGEERNENQENKGGGQSRKEKPVYKRVLGPERPAFLDRSPESETWMPPQGNIGEGRLKSKLLK